MSDTDADNPILRHLRVLDDAAAERLERRLEALIRRAGESSAQAQEDAAALDAVVARAMRSRSALDERLRVGARLLRMMDGASTPSATAGPPAADAGQLQAIERRLRALESTRAKHNDVTKGEAERAVRLVRIVEDAERNVAVMLARAAELHAEAMEHGRIRREQSAADASRASREDSDRAAEPQPELTATIDALENLVELLFETELNERQRDYVAAARRSVEAIQRIVSREEESVESGARHAARDVVEIRQRVRDVLRQFDDVADDHDVDIRVRCADQVPDALLGDLGRFRQALYYVVARALQLARPGDIDLAIEAVDDVTNDIVLRFAARQWRSEQTRAQPPPAWGEAAAGGSSAHAAGFGLLIARQLVEAMGGELGVQDDGDDGFEVWFTARFALPAETDNDGRACPSLRQEGLRCSFGDVVDLSRAGMRVRGGRSASGVVDVTIGEGEEEIELRAEVVSHRRLGLLRHEMELRFLDVTPQLAARLGRLCTNHRHVPGLGGR